MKQKCFQITTKRVRRSQQFHLRRQPVTCSRCSNRKGSVANTSTCPQPWITKLTPSKLLVSNHVSSASTDSVAVFTVSAKWNKMCHNKTPVRLLKSYITLYGFFSPLKRQLNSNIIQTVCQPAKFQVASICQISSMREFTAALFGPVHFPLPSNSREFTAWSSARSSCWLRTI